MTMWPNWIRRMTSNHKIAGSSPVMVYASLAQLVRAYDC